MEQDKRSWKSTQISQFCKKNCYDKNISGHGEGRTVIKDLKRQFKTKGGEPPSRSEM